MANPQLRHSASEPPDEVQARVQELFEAHYAGLCRFVNRCVRSRAVAEDLVQDVFLKVWRQQQADATTRVSKGYLYQAARNHALDYLRHHKIERAWADRAHRESTPGGHQPQPDLELHSDDLARAVRAAVERLPERCRLVFLLRREQELSYDEIAQALDISVKTVENHMGRALRTLKARLAPYLSLGALVASAAEVLRLVR